MVGYIIAQEVLAEGGTANFDGLFTGSFTGSVDGNATGTVSGTFESKKVAYVFGPNAALSINAAADLTYDTTQFLDTANFSGSDDAAAFQIGIVKDGNYKVTFCATAVQTSNNSPTSQQIRLQEDTCGEYANIDNALVKTNIADQGDNVASLARTILRTFTSGTLLKVVGVKLTGAGNNEIEADSFGFMIEEL